MGDVTSEELYLRKDMQNCIQMFGEDHELTVTAKYNMAIFLRNEKKNEAALYVQAKLRCMSLFRYGKSRDEVLREISEVHDKYPDPAP